MALCLLPGCSKDSGGSQSALSSFSADTLDGGKFTDSDIKAKDVTIINFWDTFCGPCIGEMPELAEYAKSLPDNAQLITVCLGGDRVADEAWDILSGSGYEGVTLIGGDEAFTSLCASVQSIPTTIFVDSEGNIVGNAIVGRQKDLAKSFTAAANNVLKESGKAELSFET